MKYTASFRDPKKPHTLSEWTYHAESFADAYQKYVGQVWQGCELLAIVKVTPDENPEVAPRRPWPESVIP